MPTISFQKIIGDCEILTSNLRPLLTEMPLLQEESEALEALITRAKSLASEQKVLTGRLREITRLRQEAQRESNDMRSRVAALLRGKLGFQNENLLGFGVPPRKRARNKRVTPQPTPTPTVPVVPAPVPGTPEPAE
jgi:hypothetical protein